jgi:aspartyl aminopeptidase
VVIKDRSDNFISRLVKIDRPILRIPTLAIHRESFYATIAVYFKTFKVDRTLNEGFKFNRETEFVPILGLIETELNKKGSVSETQDQKASSIQDNHHSVLLSLLADELAIAPEAVHDFELCVLLCWIYQAEPPL